MSATVHSFHDGAPVPIDAMDRREAERFIEFLTGDRRASVNFRLIHDRDRDADAIKFKGKLDQFWPGIEGRQAQGYGVFVVVNEGGDSAAEINRVRAAFVDADDLPLPERWHLQPDALVIRDERHWHAYWLVKDLPVEGFREAQRRLAAYYGTDRAVCDRSRVMRLPGTLHLKDPSDPYTLTLDMTCADPCRVGLNAEGLLAGLPEIARPEPSTAAVPGIPLTPEEITARLACCDPDCAYPDWRDLAGALHATPCTEPDFDKAEAFAAWSRRGNKYESDEDCRDVYETMPPKDGGLAAGSFIRLTNAAGYLGPTAGKNDLSSAEVFGDAVARLAANRSLPELAHEPRQPGCVLLRDEITQDQRKPVEWMVQGILPDCGTVMIFAPFNSYKSFIASDLALAVAAGVPAFARLPVRSSGPVVYLLGEGAAGFETQRRPAWRIAREIEPRRRLPIFTAEGTPRVGSAEDVAAYVAAVASMAEPPRLIVVDTLARSMAGLNENDAGDAALYLEMAEEMVRRFRCCVLTVAHAGKEEGRGARGSSAFEAGVDNVWKVEADTEALTAKLIPVKLKDDGDARPIFLQGRKVALPSGKTSLAFDVVDREEYAKASGKRAGVSRAEVGAALKALGAVNGTTMTTHVVAMEIAGPGADAKLISAKEKNLRDNARGRFAAYVAHLGSGRHDATLWTFPALEEGGDYE